MPSVDELLNAAEITEVTLTETNDKIEIDADTRTMIIPDTERIFGVMSDEKGERKYFRCKRFVGNGIDLSKLSLRIVFQNASGLDTGKDKYIVTDLATDGEDYITFSWELSRKVTEYKGIISFIVCAIKTNSDGTIINEWNTTLANGIVLEGLEANGTQEQEEVAKDYYNQLEAELLRVANEQKTEIEKKAQEVIGTIPSDYTQMQKDISNLKGDLGDLDNGYKAIGRFIDEQYIRNNGTFSKYTGWSRTDFISCEGMDKLYIVSPQSSYLIYNAFYTERDTATFISYFTIKSNDVAEIQVPDRAKYFALSNETDVIRNTHIMSQYHNRIVKAEELISRHEDILETIRNRYVLYETYPDSYIKYDSGEIAAFKGWDRTGFISCEGKSEIGIVIDVSDTNSVRSNAFYAEADCSSFITNFKTPNTGYNKIRVPDGAKYFAISNNSATMKTLKIVDDTANLLKDVKATSSLENCDTSIYRRGNILPEYYFTMPNSTDSASFSDNEYIEGKIAEVGNDAFIYICDTHWKSNAQQSNMLIGYVKKRLGIRNVLFGGGHSEPRNQQVYGIGRDEKIYQ